MPGPLGFSALPADLKPISPFIQRADELKTSEPIVAYWCTYYAAQQGIGLGAKGAPARTFLGELLGTLENMKANIRANDPDAREIIDSEAASSAYVESFALKVFNLADNEDRAGNATRSTAKKFLAAANFIEVLKIFDQPELVESHVDKIKYAKWKAADIARAFREGRTPVPGPANATPELPTLADLPPPSTSPVPGSTPSRELESTAFLHLSPEDLARPGLLGPPAERPKHDAPQTPGAWSTLATPGERTPLGASGPSGNPLGAVGDERGAQPEDYPTAPLDGAHLLPAEEHAPLGRAESTASILHGDTGATALPRANANADALDIDPAERVEAPTLGAGLMPGEADATPGGAESDASVLAGDTAATGLAHASGNADALGVGAPAAAEPSSPPVVRTPVVTRSPLPPGFVPSPATSPRVGRGTSVPPPGFVPTSPSTGYGAAVPPPPILFQHHSPQSHSGGYPPPQPIVVPPPRQPTPPELTPILIAKIQKHCRFAASALDYEDAETARKELRTALAMLGG